MFQQESLIIHIHTRCTLKVSRQSYNLPRQKWTMIETLIFFKIVSLVSNTLIPVSFLLFKAPWNSPYKMVCTIIFLLMPVLSSNVLPKTIQSNENNRRDTCTISFFAKNSWSKNIELLIKNWELAAAPHEKIIMKCSAGDKSSF